MRIRLKIVLIVLPLLVATLVLTGMTSSLSARSGVTRIAMDFLSFKSQDLKKYMDSQWNLLLANDLSAKPEFVNLAKASTISFARTLVRSETERIFGLDHDGKIAMETSKLELTEAEGMRLVSLLAEKKGAWIDAPLGGRSRVGQGFTYEPFGWSVFVTEEKAVFYREVNEIMLQSGIILLASCAVSLVLLLLFSGYLTRPLTRMVGVMRRIIADNDLSSRVAVEYRDETGDLAHTFNIMIGELEKAYSQIKSFAFKAVLAKQQEQEIRNIFQKYVPRDVIDRCFLNPESMLVGENRTLSVLFSDIRSFTTISEGLPPDELVHSLNRYFSLMVDIIMKHGGIVDKYIGDAIMAFFGAPVHHPDDALRSVVSAFEMHDALALFNKEQETRGRPNFRIGIGIAYGEVTIGNIGSERKMDYTVIGDMVNLANRLEGLTKLYSQPLVFSENVHAQVRERVPCRLVDRVVVKGRTQGENIYTAKRALGEGEEAAWDIHQRAMNRYYDRRFAEAASLFREVSAILPGDPLAALYLSRCAIHGRTPPPAEWNGIELMKEK
jgi:class 3 adenylate cyclase/HAMP domain-containing protein